MATILIRETEIKITDVLSQIATGLTYKQILDKYPQLELTDILMSAKTASEIIDTMMKVRQNHTLSVSMEFIVKDNQMVSIDAMRQKHKRAFVKWNSQEIDQLVALFKQEKPVEEIAKILERSPESIKIKLRRMGMME